MKKYVIAAAMAAIVLSAPTAALAQGDSGFNCGRGCATATTTPTTVPPTVPPAPTTTVPPTETPVTTVPPTTQTTVQPVAPEQSNNPAPEQETAGGSPANPAPEQRTTQTGSGRQQNQTSSRGSSTDGSLAASGSTPATAPETPVAPETARVYESALIASLGNRPVVTASTLPVKSSSSTSNWMLYSLIVVVAAAGVQVLVRTKGSRNSMVLVSDIPTGVLYNEETETVKESAEDVLA